MKLINFGIISRFKGDDDKNDEYDQTNYIDNDPLGLKS